MLRHNKTMDVDRADESGEASLPQQFAAANALSATLLQLHSSAVSSHDADAAHQLRTAANLKFLHLKQVSRELNIATEDVRRATAARRADVDEAHLQLQNLVYEKAHLVKEIGVARDFRPSTQPIELVAAEQYDRTVPADQRLDTLGAHRYHLARLQHELAERQRLVARVEELTRKKRVLAGRNAAKRQQMSSVLSHIENVAKAAAPLYQILHLPSDRIRPDARAQLLPPALYTLYCAAYAHKAAFDGEIEVSIEGSEDEARLLLADEIAQANGGSTGGDGTADSDGGDEMVHGEAKRAKAAVSAISWWPAMGTHANQSASSSASASPSSSTTASATVTSAGDLVAAHPLHIVVHVNTLDASKALVLVLRFVYLRHLDIVTLLPAATAATAASGSNKAAAPSPPLPWLANLFPPSVDAGTQLPIGKHNLLFPQSHSVFNSSVHGFAYRWVQQVCGLHTADPNPPIALSSVSVASSASSSSTAATSVAASLGVSPAHLHTFAEAVRAVRARVQSRALMVAHAASLERLEFPFDTQQTRYARPRARLAAFASAATTTASDSCSGGAGGAADVFRIRVQREPLPDIEATMTVHAGYPRTAPTFALAFASSSTSSSSTAALSSLLRSDADASAHLAHRADAASVAFVRALGGGAGGSTAAEMALSDLEYEMNHCAHTVLVELFGSAAAATAAASTTASTVALGALGADGLLMAALVRKLQICVDLLVESERSDTRAASGGDDESTSVTAGGNSVGVPVTSFGGRMFERPVRGRDRRRPFFFDGLQFDQR